MAKETVTIDSLTPADRKAVMGLRARVVAMANDFSIVRKKVKDIAEPVLALFTKIQHERGRANFTMADFARTFDPSVPTFGKSGDQGEGYRAHPVYLAIEYMERSTRKRATGGRSGVFNGAAARLERMIATLLTVAKDPEPLYKAFSEAFGLTSKALATLKRRVGEVEPLIDLSSIIKPVNLEGAKVVHMKGVNPVADIESMRGKLDGLHAKGQRVSMEGGKRRKVA